MSPCSLVVHVLHLRWTDDVDDDDHYGTFLARPFLGVTRKKVAISRNSLAGAAGPVFAAAVAPPSLPALTSAHIFN